MSVGAVTMVSDTLAQPPPIATVKSHSMWFRTRHSELDETLPLPQAPDVETEFQKYAMGEVSSKDTDILWFWEVRSFQLDGAMT